jgi:hypothetical protein
MWTVRDATGGDAIALKRAIPAIGAYGIGIHDELTPEWRAPGTATVEA